jgi:DNA-binding PadR family transcriptional regulator
MKTPKPASNLSPEYPLLGLLAQQPAHGYELHQRLTSEFGQIWHISLSQTYNILKRLESQGAIAGEDEEQENRPPRRYFHLTEEGRQRFLVWLDSTVGCSTRAIRIEFLTRLAFAESLRPELVADLLERQIAEIKSGMARLEKSLEKLPAEETYNHLALQLRVRQLAPMLEWLSECQQAWRENGNFDACCSDH